MADVFVSYSQKDRLSADAIRRGLEKLGFDVWTDKNLEPGLDIGEQIVSELAQAKVIVVLVSASYLDSQWAQLEVGAALARSREAGTIVVPVLLEGAKLPAYLSQFPTEDFRDLPPEEIANKLRVLARRLPVHA